jgi:hypothetical protein
MVAGQRPCPQPAESQPGHLRSTLPTVCTVTSEIVTACPHRMHACALIIKKTTRNPARTLRAPSECTEGECTDLARAGKSAHRRIGTHIDRCVASNVASSCRTELCVHLLFREGEEHAGWHPLRLWVRGSLQLPACHRWRSMQQRSDAVPLPPW